MKKTVKKQKPAFVVDLTTAEDSFDVMLAFAIARFEAKVPLTNNDLDCIVLETMYSTLDVVADATAAFAAFVAEIAPKKKTPWYKKLWNWITKPFKNK